MALTDKLSAIGNAIRAKTGGTDMLTLDQMPTAIAGIQTGSSSGWDESTVKSLIERSSILNLTLPSDLTKIGEGAFYGCKYLKNITLPNTVTRIENFAFDGCSSLILNSIPSNVEYIGDGAFSGCSNINFTKLPNGLTTIHRNAFNTCINLALTSIPSVHSIEDSAFYSCKSLNITTISARYIKDNAFAYCNSLTEIHYSGTKEQWNSLTNIPTNTGLTVYCINGNITY